MTGRLLLRDDDGDDGRCQECGNALAAGPCASCEAMICGDCGVTSRDPVGEKVICISCARLIADVRQRPPRSRPPLLRVVAVAVAIAFAFAAVVATLLWGCGSRKGAPESVSPAPVAPTVKPPALRRTRTVTPPAGVGGLGGEQIRVARVFAFADAQLHYLFGKRTVFQSPWADRRSFEVAVRPAALDDGSDLLLALFLDEKRRFFPDHTLQSGLMLLDQSVKKLDCDFSRGPLATAAGS